MHTNFRELLSIKKLDSFLMLYIEAGAEYP